MNCKRIQLLGAYTAFLNSFSQKGFMGTLLLESSTWEFLLPLFVNNSFKKLSTVVKYMWHKIDHYNHFLVYSSSALNTLTLLGGQHHHPSPECFHHLKLNLCTHETVTPITSSSQLLVTIILPCCSMYPFPSFLRSNSIPLYVYTTVCLPVHWWTLGLFPPLIYGR